MHDAFLSAAEAQKIDTAVTQVLKNSFTNVIFVDIYGIQFHTILLEVLDARSAEEVAEQNNLIFSGWIRWEGTKA